MKNKFFVLLVCKLFLRYFNVIFCNGNKRIMWLYVKYIILWMVGDKKIEWNFLMFL